MKKADAGGQTTVISCPLSLRECFAIVKVLSSTSGVIKWVHQYQNAEAQSRKVAKSQNDRRGGSGCRVLREYASR
jgi:hypothetical protein